MAYTRERTCCDCGKAETIRKDNPATRCCGCSCRMNGAKGNETIRARALVSTCQYCQKRYRGRALRFCSLACRRQHQADMRLNRKCVECGAAFSVAPSVLNTNATARFCSRPCYHKFLCRTERTTGRGSQWAVARNEAVRVAPFCAICGTTKTLQVHHAVPFRLTRDNSQGNLVPLCVRHHRWVETMFVETERHGVPPEARLLWMSMLRERQMAVATYIRNFARANHQDGQNIVAQTIRAQPAQE